MTPLADIDDLGRESRGFLRRHDTTIILTLLVAAFIFVYYWQSIVIAIRPGEAGVLWSRIFGTQVDYVYQEGTHLILPIDKMIIYNVRYQKVDRSFVVLSNDGLAINVDTTIRFRPVDKLLGRLHQQIGPDYVETIVVPEVGTAIRTTVNEYSPEQLYQAQFRIIQQDILTHAQPRVLERFVLLDDVLVRAITLPPSVAGAIQHKLEEKQASDEMVYRLAREVQEAERKRTEAQGIRDALDIVSAGLSNDKLLQFKGIEATLELAKSPNSKVVIIGGGKDGLPVILGSDAFTQVAPKAK
jgi:regulator of protease activity HflC (stomatin/prohibitin superfamily)